MTRGGKRSKSVGKLALSRQIYESNDLFSFIGWLWTILTVTLSPMRKTRANGYDNWSLEKFVSRDDFCHKLFRNLPAEKLTRVTRRNSRKHIIILSFIAIRNKIGRMENGIYQPSISLKKVFLFPSPLNFYIFSSFFCLFPVAKSTRWIHEWEGICNFYKTSVKSARFLVFHK